VFAKSFEGGCLSFHANKKGKGGYVGTASILSGLGNNFPPTLTRIVLANFNFFIRTAATSVLLQQHLSKKKTPAGPKGSLK
jgi:hypothetical protein